MAFIILIFIVITFPTTISYAFKPINHFIFTLFIIFLIMINEIKSSIKITMDSKEFIPNFIDFFKFK